MSALTQHGQGLPEPTVKVEEGIPTIFNKPTALCQIATR